MKKKEKVFVILLIWKDKVFLPIYPSEIKIM